MEHFVNENEAQHIRSAQESALKDDSTLPDKSRRMNCGTQIGKSRKQLPPVVGKLWVDRDRKLLPRHCGQLNRDLTDALARARRESRAYPEAHWFEAKWSRGAAEKERSMPAPKKY